MRERTRRLRVTGLAATAAAAALTAGMIGPAHALGPRPTTPATASDTGPARTANTGRAQRVLLVTGDRVTVAADGRVLRFEPAKGREKIPVRIERTAGRTLVTPADARALITAGTLDERLFDVAGLADPKLRARHGDGLRLIVRYDGPARAARAALRTTGARVERALPGIDAEALGLTPAAGAALWEALTDPASGATRSAAPGIARIWLDGVRRASLDKSTRQIGADKAWQAGFDGAGTKIAVLDTGVDKTHPDLKDRVLAEENFSTSPDAVDRYGHGTHVASIAAGSGAASGGTYRGVAPGAKLLSGKVLDDDGYGDDSGIIAGMEWAAAQGADVVNLSLGGRDTPGADPLETAVNTLTAEKGVLFAIAAGNEGGDATVGSPGTADAALTVGAVDSEDRLAPFSSRGPRPEDGAVKPDLTAPGVDIAAAAAPGSVIDTDPSVPHPAPGYLRISGTSMATPHVAGAAAILKQRFPAWKPADLKGALTASTKPGAGSVYAQGTGRVQVDKALGQSVVADRPSVFLGTQTWPHEDDEPLTGKVGYRNLGDTDVTLDLTVAGTDAQGRPTPTGLFTLGATRVTVPAGGTAEVDLTADTRLGTADGVYSAHVTATGGGQSVRSGAAVDREVESYDLTVKTLDRRGEPTDVYAHSLSGLSGAAENVRLSIDGGNGTRTVRVPKGSYSLDGAVFQDPADGVEAGIDWLVRPRLEINGPTTVVQDARTAKPVELTVPGLKNPDLAVPLYERRTANGSMGSGWLLTDGLAGFRTAHAGPEVTDGSVLQSWNATFLKDPRTQYSLSFGGTVRRLATGWVKHVRARDLATVEVALGASVADRTVYADLMPGLPGSALGGFSLSAPQPALGTRTFLVSTADGVTWRQYAEQWGAPDAQGRPTVETAHISLGSDRYAPGRTHRERVGTGVFGPVLAEGTGILRTAPDPDTGEQSLLGVVPLFGDGDGRAGSVAGAKARTILYRDGVKVAENDDPLTGAVPIPVTSQDAAYRLTTSVEYPSTTTAVSTRVETGFSFRSKRVSELTTLPASTVRFAAPLDLRSRAEADRRLRIPVTVQGSAASRNLKSLRVQVSHDAGRTWKSVPVIDGHITVHNPPKGKGISLRAEITDKQHNTSTLTLHNAYLTK
ncbi:S8 family peptidase [Streptomyces sp. BI20]|uniref:S8 family peptidase n=1 Tax=Streptomyces sp. BI20 TaxID=3403460 RepID=UPI003C7507F0